jgi:arylsulfatase A-like enzyme
MGNMEEQDFSDCSIIMINLDGLRKDRIEKCPTLKTIKEENVYFSKMISVSPYTLTAHHAIFSGLYPCQNGVDAYYHMFKFKDEITTFPEILTKNGFFTKADVVSKNIIPKRGFEEITEFDEKTTNFSIRHGEIIKKIAENEKFFLFLHYEGVHSKLLTEIMKKYDPKENEDEYFKNIKENNERYDSYLDDCENYVQSIRKAVSEISKDKKIIVIWFADHGTSVGERKGEKFYGVYTYDYTINSFCIIDYPAGIKKIDTQCSILDIFPTCLEIADVNYSLEYDLEGKSLLPWVKKNVLMKNDEEPVFVETGGLYGYWPSPKKHNVFCVRYEDKKLIYNDTPKSWEFYNLEMDPEEISNIYDENSNEVKKFKQMLIDYLSKLGIKTKITS